MSCIVWTVAVAVFAMGAVVAGAAEKATPSADHVAYFEHTIRPLLAAHCYECHSAQSKVLQGGLLLDSRAGWQKGGDSGEVIAPGDPDHSLLVRAVEFRDDADVQMPPKGKLNEREIAALRHWVELGAPDPRNETPAAAAPKRTINLDEERKHWAYQPLSTAEPPKADGDAWSRTPVDRFIAKSFKEQELHGNPIADRRTLVRRAYFDLLGLPPTPEEVEAFDADESSTTWDALLDKLLDRPEYGERWARYWLDLARFAESHGYEQDYDRPHAYQYRDFVIRAFNQDLPYDTFVRWQLAGDEFEPANANAMAATGFLAAGVHATQITANQAEKERYDELDDMVRTVGTTMLGLTIGCARCHDHKFDPIFNADYYSLAAVFTTTVRSNQFVNYEADKHDRDRKEFEKQLAPLVAKRQAYERKVLDKRFDAWLKNEAALLAESSWIVTDPQTITEADAGTAKVLDDGSVRFLPSNQLKGNTRTFSTYVELKDLRAVRIEALTDPQLPHGGPGWGETGNFQLDELSVTVEEPSALGDAKPRPITLRRLWVSNGRAERPLANSDNKQQRLPWKVEGQAGKPQVAIYIADKSFGSLPGFKIKFMLKFAGNDAGIGRVRISLRQAAEPLDPNGYATAYRAVAARERARLFGRETLASDELEALRQWHRTLDHKWQKLDRRVADMLAKQPFPRLERALVCSEGVPAVRLHTQGPDFYEKTYMLRRGDANQKLDEAAPGYLQVLMNSPERKKQWYESPPEGSTTSYRRRALANWITDTRYGAGQLLARVIVNRLWEHHLGRGLVGTPSDFGASGERPSHPELLDYLAEELIRNGWRLKPIHKLIMGSAVYMQTAETDRARLIKDVDNRYCWHRPIVRLEAEAIRDAMLATSGQLDRRMYGPGSLDPAQRRRSVYFFVKRSKLMPMMTLFDGPDTLQDLAVRAETTIAPQSLLLMNNANVRDCAAAMAGRIRKDRPDDESAAIVLGYRLALGRDPSAAELRKSQQFIEVQRSAYRKEGRDDSEALAWGDYCQVLFCLNEFIYIR